MKPLISLCASAIRVKFWEQLLNSLKGNKIKYEVILVGNVKPEFDISKYPELKYIYSPVKPCQCYEIAFREAKGELVHWSTDDSTYDLHHENNLDIAYNRFNEFNKSNNLDRKLVLAMRPIEDGRDVYQHHHLFGGWHNTPYMAPFGVMDRELLLKLGGYDKHFICGQTENDMVMRVLEVGGKVELCMESYVAVHHVAVHKGARGKFRKWYPQDRKRLEDCWVKEGYGAVGPGRSKVFEPTISLKRLKTVEKFPEENITTVSTDPRGDW